MATREVTLHQLGLQAADIVAIVQDGNQQAMAELDDRVVRHAVLNFGPRPDVPCRRSTTWTRLRRRTRCSS